MRWRKGRRSANIEDRRGMRMGGTGVKLGGGTLVVVMVVGLLLGQNPLQLLGMLSGEGGLGGSVSQAPTKQSAQSNEDAEFVSVVLADTEDTWNGVFSSFGQRYRPANLVLFTDQVQSACGMNTAATGPFYCPGDSKVYIDLGFFNELKGLGAPGDFARAYVLGHEIGHHVQNLMGTADKVHQARQRSSRSQANALSVLMELQADCYAGVWAHHANKQRNLLEAGDVEEGLNAAAAIGDDRLLRRAGRSASPESFTHGSSEQRVYWLRKGMQSGDIKTCNTFAQASR